MSDDIQTKVLPRLTKLGYIHHHPKHFSCLVHDYSGNGSWKYSFKTKFYLFLQAVSSWYDSCSWILAAGFLQDTLLSHPLRSDSAMWFVCFEFRRFDTSDENARACFWFSFLQLFLSVDFKTFRQLNFHLIPFVELFQKTSYIQGPRMVSTNRRLSFRRIDPSEADDMGTWMCVWLKCVEMYFPILSLGFSHRFCIPSSYYFISRICVSGSFHMSRQQLYLADQLDKPLDEYSTLQELGLEDGMILHLVMEENGTRVVGYACFSFQLYKCSLYESFESCSCPFLYFSICSQHHCWTFVLIVQSFRLLKKLTGRNHSGDESHNSILFLTDCFDFNVNPPSQVSTLARPIIKTDQSPHSGTTADLLLPSFSEFF